MKAPAFATYLFSGALAILATDCPAEVPRVETNFGQMAAGQWGGKRFRDMVSPERIQRIIRLTEHGFSHHNNSQPDYQLLVQADYDGLIAHLIASNEKASNWSLAANERTSARLLFVTTDNQIFEVEILTSGMKTSNITAILISGAGIGARIDVKGFNRAAPRK